MVLPSAELMSEVFGKKVEHVESNLSYFAEHASAMLGIRINGVNVYWNIYQIGHMCKEWALKKHELSIHSGSEGFQSSWYQADVYETKDYKLLKIRQETGLTEIDAIVTACEWIRKR